MRHSASVSYANWKHPQCYECLAKHRRYKYIGNIGIVARNQLNLWDIRILHTWKFSGISPHPNQQSNRINEFQGNGLGANLFEIEYLTPVECFYQRKFNGCVFSHVTLSLLEVCQLRSAQLVPDMYARDTHQLGIRQSGWLWSVQLICITWLNLKQNLPDNIFSQPNVLRTYSLKIVIKTRHETSYSNLDRALFQSIIPQPKHIGTFWSFQLPNLLVSQQNKFNKKRIRFGRLAIYSISW